MIYTHFMNIDEETYEKYKNIDFTAKNINKRYRAYE